MSNRGLIERAMKSEYIHDLVLTHATIAHAARRLFLWSLSQEWVVIDVQRTLYSGPDLQAALAALIAD